MKKNYLHRLFALICTLFFAVSFTAVKASAVNDYGQYIFDDAGLLTDAEAESLNSYARQVSEFYECGVHIITTADETVDENNIQQYAEDTYLQYIDFGWGEDKDGFLLVLGMYDRTYYLLAYGPWGNYALTDYGKDQMADQFLDNFAEDDWYGGFEDYISYAEHVLGCAQEGQPVDVYYSSEDTDVGIEAYFIAAVIGLVAAAITCSSYKRQMRTAVLATEAEEYVDVGRTDIRIRSDKFKYMSRTEEKIESEDKNRGGTTVNSRGFSGKKGKF